MVRKRPGIWPYAFASAVLMLLPAWVSQGARLTLVSGVRPVRNLADMAQALAERSWEKVRPPSGDDELQRQNEFLRSQVVTLHVRNGELESKLQAATAARSVAAAGDYELVPADIIIDLDSSTFRQTITLNRGSSDGIEPGMLVLYHSHVIGRIQDVAPWTSRAVLVTDPAFRAGAVSVPKLAEGSLALSKRDTGLFKGTGTEKGLLEWLAGETPVEEGAYVVTADDPMNGVPKGLILGRVTGIDRGRGAYPRVEVTPIVNPQGLEFVLILRRVQ